MDEHYKQKVIEKDEIKSLTADHIRRIKTLAIKCDTKIQVEQAVGRIVVAGESEDLLHVVSEILEMLGSIKDQAHARDRAEMIAKEVQWYYLEQGVRKPYESDINAEIEVAYCKKEQKLQLNLEDGYYEIDFQSMEETKLDDSSSTVKVFRKDLKESMILLYDFKLILRR